MKKLLFDCGPRDTQISFAILFLRITISLMMLSHGISKIQGFADLTKKFEEMKALDFFPFQYLSGTARLSLCIGAEVLAPALLILGLATRPAAFVFAFNMVIAAFAVLGAAPWFAAGPGEISKEPALLYLIPGIFLILSGAGAFSLDAALDGEKRRRW